MTWRKIRCSLNETGNLSRQVTMMERDQPHKTPVTSTWTPDYLTREGEVSKAVGDWLRDKTITWKHAGGGSSKRMRAFFHVRSVFKNEVSIQMVSVVCVSAVGRWSLISWVEDPSTVPLGTSRAVCPIPSPRGNRCSQCLLPAG